MNQEPNHSFLFGSQVDPPRQWRSYATSLVVHIAVVILLLLIPIAITREVQERTQLVTTLIAPQIKPYKPKIKPPKVEPPKTVAKNFVAPKLPEVKPRPEVKPLVPPPPAPKIVEETPKPIPQPQVAAAAPKPLPKIDTPEPAPAPALKAQVKTGIFGQQEAAKNVQVSKQAKVGGFGDPNGVQASPDSKSTLMAKVGGFDMPQGEGNSGGGGRGNTGGVVRQGGFGSAEGSGSGPGGTGKGIGNGTVKTSGFGSPDGGGGNGTGGNGKGGTVKTGSFGENQAPAPQQVQKPKVENPATTPVEILTKPRPVYTQEARNLHLEGQVAVEVIFGASGSVQVVRVVSGLGHGLDQAAEQAASQIRFRPGTRGGVPVDTRATVRITFELT
jgi:TonB family protein